MYRLKNQPKKMIKVAGSKMPKNRKRWPAEIIKQLVSQHSYIPTDNIETTIKYENEEKKQWTGQLNIKNIIIPFTIREVDEIIQLDPFDIFWDGEQFRALNEDSFARASTAEIGKMVSKDKYVAPNNEYIGESTGDSSPLQAVPTIGHVKTGAYTRRLGSTGSHALHNPRKLEQSWLIESVIKNEEMLDQLEASLAQYSGIGSAVAQLGLNTERMRLNMIESDMRPVIAHVYKEEGNNFGVIFNDNDYRQLHIEDLKDMLGDTDFKRVLRAVLRFGRCIMRNFPTNTTINAKSLNSKLYFPIRRPGQYKILSADKSFKSSFWVMPIYHFDGEEMNQWKAVNSLGMYSIGVRFMGLPCRKTGVMKDMMLPISKISAGQKGFFINEAISFSALPNIEIKRIDKTPDMTVIYGYMEYEGSPVALIPTNGILHPQRIPSSHRHTLPPDLPELSYYLPDTYPFVKAEKHISLCDKAHVVESRPELTVKKTASGDYWLRGTISGGKTVNEVADCNRAIHKLATLGAPDEFLNEVENMDYSSEMTAYGLRNMIPREKEFTKEAKSYNFDYTLIKSAAAQAMQALEASDDLRDSKAVVDSVLSLNFTSDENLEELVGSKDLFLKCEDKIARLLLAARQGAKVINEKAASKALKSIGRVQKSLTSLAIELDHNE